MFRKSKDGETPSQKRESNNNFYSEAFDTKGHNGYTYANTTFSFFALSTIIPRCAEDHTHTHTPNCANMKTKSRFGMVDKAQERSFCVQLSTFLIKIRGTYKTQSTLTREWEI